MGMTEYIIKVDENKKDIDGGMPLQDKPQELVRCKDCKWFINDHNEVDGWMTCTLLRQEVDKEWFCANGERKDDAAD